MTQPPADLPVELLDAAVELLGQAGRQATVRVRGGSMIPTLRPGALVAVEFAPHRLRCGELLLFRQADYLVVHRLLGSSRFADGRPGLRTRGDATIALDPRLDPDHVVGRVLAAQDGAIWRDLQTPRGRAYGRALAWHGLFWAALGALAHLRPLAARVDRALLRLAHRALFRACHPEIPEPPCGRTA